MIIKHIEWNTYELPFITPITTARTKYDTRKGYIVRVVDGAGNYGVGDISPLAEFGTESHESISELLSELKNNLELLSIIQPNPRSIFNGLQEYQDFPAFRAGIEHALIMLASKHVNKTIPEFLLLTCGEQIHVNGLIGMLTPEETLEKAQDLISSGYRTIKLKIGRDDFDQDIECVNAIRKIDPDISLRLDVNGAWDEASALIYLDKLAGFNIEYVEDPFTNTDYTALASLRNKFPIKIALDEFVQSLDTVLKISESNAADTLIIKPVICGGLLNAIRMMHTAKEYNVKTVISSVFESALGRSVGVLLASTRSDTAHGLSTAQFFAGDIIEDPFPVINGRIKINDPGMFTINL